MNDKRHYVYLCTSNFIKEYKGYVSKTANKRKDVPYSYYLERNKTVQFKVNIKCNITIFGHNNFFWNCFIKEIITGLLFKFILHLVLVLVVAILLNILPPPIYILMYRNIYHLHKGCKLININRSSFMQNLPRKEIC